MLNVECSLLPIAINNMIPSLTADQIVAKYCEVTSCLVLTRTLSYLLGKLTFLIHAYFAVNCRINIVFPP